MFTLSSAHIFYENQPAAVIVWVPLKRGRSPHQAHPREGVVIREQRVRQAGDAIWLVVNILPVRVQSQRPLRKRSKQVGIQLVHYLLVHAGLKLPGKEGGPHRLLQRRRARREASRGAKQGQRR